MVRAALFISVGLLLGNGGGGGLTKTMYLPVVITAPQAEKCFAWADGPRLPEQAAVAGAECYHNWTIEESRVEGLVYLPIFWAEYRFGTNMLDRLRWLEATDWDGTVRYAGQPVVIFLNEPDLRSQAATPPDEAARLYFVAKDACPSCVFFGPGVSAWDAHCDWPEQEEMPWHNEIHGWGQWCYWQQFWHEVAQLDSVASIRGRELASVHHYDSVAWHVPKRGVAPLDPLEELAALGAKKFVISEYGSCDPVMMRQMVAAYDTDKRVVAHAVWVPQLRPIAGWEWCEVLFEYGTVNLTAVGEAWRDG